MVKLFREAFQVRLGKFFKIFEELVKKEPFKNIPEHWLVTLVDHLNKLILKKPETPKGHQCLGRCHILVSRINLS